MMGSTVRGVSSARRVGGRDELTELFRKLTAAADAVRRRNEDDERERHALLPTCLSASRGHAVPRVAGAEFAEAVVTLDLIDGEYDGSHGNAGVGRGPTSWSS